MPAPRSILSASRLTLSLANGLRSYFYSGWAFLIPYLAVYLLYYVTKWPVNPMGKGVGSQESGVSIADTTVSLSHTLSNSLSSFVPCMLHVYWALHAVHVILAGIALFSWWKQNRLLQEETEEFATENTELRHREHRGADPILSVPISDNQWLKKIRALFSPLTPVQTNQQTGLHKVTKRSDPAPDISLPPKNPPGSVHSVSELRDLCGQNSESNSTPDVQPFSLSALFIRVAPWALLALIFYIPGVYLEWPSDPWEHLRRINEWRILDTVGAHSSWMKSAYFIPYSLLSWCIGLRQLFWLDFYYTGICLLLCWQYYRFSRACGLGERASMVFVIIQALLFGNNIFSFYRYYGISSSIYAQLGAIALTRIVLEFASRGTKLEKTERPVREKDIERQEDTSEPLDLQSLPILPSSTSSSLPSLPRLSFLHVFWFLTSLICLLALTALNHPQGIGIAGLGIVAVIVWRLIEWKRSALWWLIGGTLVINALYLWLYSRPPIIEAYRAQGWLTSWYGFNLVSSTSPAFERALQILGAFGILNLVLGIWLITRRDHIAGWLTLMPVFALILPCFALPFAQLLASGGADPTNIVAFHRLLFSIPTGFAIIAAYRPQAPEETVPRDDRARTPIGRYGQLARGAALTLLFLAPETFSHYRLWQNLQITPDDLQLRGLVQMVFADPVAQCNETTLRIDTQLSFDVQEAFRPDRHSFAFRRSPALLEEKQLRQRLDWITNLEVERAWVQAKWYGLETFALKSPAHPDSASKLSRTVAAPTATTATWLVFSGHAPEAVFADGHLALATPDGQASETFSPDLIPVSHSKRYQLSSTIRQEGNPVAMNYLAVAWFDPGGRLLRSNVPAPRGAGTPLGWTDGTYSYYGLSGQPAPPQDTSYLIRFGLGESAEIPRNAAYMRVGALLNYQATIGTKVTLSNVILVELPPPSQLRMGVTNFSRQTTPSSSNATLSGHWSPNHVSTAQAGVKELHEALNLVAKH